MLSKIMHGILKFQTNGLELFWETGIQPVMNHSSLHDGNACMYNIHLAT